MSAISLARRRAAAPEQVGGRAQDPRRAEAALQGVVLAERLLQRAPLEPFDRPDLGAVGLHREQQAGAHRDAVELDGARAADAVLAADVRAGQAELWRRKSESSRRGSTSLADAAAVDGDARSRDAAPRTRSTTTRTRCAGSPPTRAGCPTARHCSRAPPRARSRVAARRESSRAASGGRRRSRPRRAVSSGDARRARAMREREVAVPLGELLERVAGRGSPPARASRRAARRARAPS